jgi:hypothetical protein
MFAQEHLHSSESVDTGVTAYQASVAAREVAVEEKQPIPDLEEGPDGHKDPAKLASLQRDLERLQELKCASRAHEYFTAMDSTGEYKSTPVVKRSFSVERLDTLDALVGIERTRSLFLNVRRWMICARLFRITSKGGVVFNLMNSP